MKKLIAIALILSACSTQHNGQWVMFGGEEECGTRRQTVCNDYSKYSKGIDKCMEDLLTDDYKAFLKTSVALDDGFKLDQINAKDRQMAKRWEIVFYKEAYGNDKCTGDLRRKHCQRIEVGYCKGE